MTRDLVLSHYKESLTWMRDIPWDRFRHVIVYHKGCADCPEGIRNKATWWPLANVGREAQTYAWHIARKWNDLADLTCFSQADPLQHAPDFVNRISIDWEEPMPLAVRYKKTHPPRWVKEKDKVVLRHGCECRWGDALINETGDPNKQGWFDQAAFGYLFARELPEHLWFGYGACWAVPKYAIERRGLKFYATLNDEIIAASVAGGRCHTVPPLNAWAMEGLWACVWADPSEYPVHDRFR